jgi:hypothetical protein
MITIKETNFSVITVLVQEFENPSEAKKVNIKL